MHQVNIEWQLNSSVDSDFGGFGTTGNWSFPNILVGMVIDGYGVKCCLCG